MFFFAVAEISRGAPSHPLQAAVFHPNTPRGCADLETARSRDVARRLHPGMYYAVHLITVRSEQQVIAVVIRSPQIP